MTGIDPFVKGKKVLLLGFGREGRSTYRMLRKSRVYQALAVADLEDKSGQLEEGIPFITGPGYQKVMDEYDVVFKSPGIVLERPAQEYGCQILSQTEVFFRLYRDQIIGITGTKGKSTTSTLMYHIFRSAGRKTILAGNIGIPAFDHMDEIQKDTDIIFELSCHQLEHITESPHIGVLLNIYEEHLDHYGTMERYVASKQQIYKNQNEQDILLCNRQCFPKEGACCSRVIPAEDFGQKEKHDVSVRQEGLQLFGREICWGENRFLIPEQGIPLLGHHNYFDIAFVYAVCKIKGITDEAFLEGLRTYEPLPHRLQFLGEQDGIFYYDDSISTICNTTIQALETLKNTDTVLIGGMDRGINYEELIRYLSLSPVSHIILMEDTGKRIYEEIQSGYPDFQNPGRLVLTRHLEDAVCQAKKLTKRGKCCVLSPAAASYGIFRNFEERGEAFKALVLTKNSKYHKKITSF